MRLVDTHTHLEQVEKVSEALERAMACGLIAVIAVGMNLASNRQVLDLAKKYRGTVYPAMGIHPWAIEADEIDETLAFVNLHIKECVAVGEIGLDYWIKKDRALQMECLEKMLALAVKHDKPVSTHSRGSYEDVFRLVSESGIRKAVFHWYSGPIEITERIVDAGYHISATPAVEYSEKHRDVIRRVPLENLLLETDCPVKHKEISSEPASIRVTLDEVAKLKGETPEAVAAVTTGNAIEIFGLDRAPA